jgi:holo-[acyl-carrier protein] synthase
MEKMQIGTDIIQIKRIEDAMQLFGERFKARIMNESEIMATIGIESIAGVWAAKEAIAKAIGCGIGHELAFHDITITKNHKGAPRFSLSAKAQKRHEVTGGSLSISHDGGFAIAVAVVICTL